MSLENVGNDYVEFFINIKHDGEISKYKIQPFLLSENGYYGNAMYQYTLIISTIPLYGGGILFGIRNQQEYIEGYEGSTISYGGSKETPTINSEVCPPAEWFALVAPEQRGHDEWVYIIYPQALVYDPEEQEYVYTSEKIWQAQSGAHIDAESGYRVQNCRGLNCSLLAKCMYIADNNVNIINNLYTVNKENGHLHRIYTINNKKYIHLTAYLVSRYN